jgi:putative Mg2+ transporter-C (MgtC) family protein
MLVGMEVLTTTDAESRVMYGIIAGMGFIGGGAILKNDVRVSGTATAASLWNTGAIGVAVAFHRYEIAIVLSLLNMLTLYVGTRIKPSIDSGTPES